MILVIFGCFLFGKFWSLTFWEILVAFLNISGHGEFGQCIIHHILNTVHLHFRVDHGCLKDLSIPVLMQPATNQGDRMILQKNCPNSSPTYFLSKSNTYATFVVEKMYSKSCPKKTIAQQAKNPSTLPPINPGLLGHFVGLS
jgi:hypothetical protein